MRPVELTPEQATTLDNLRRRWPTVGEPTHLPREQAVAVCWLMYGPGSRTCPARVWYCIEPDGHAHT